MSAQRLNMEPAALLELARELVVEAGELVRAGREKALGETSVKSTPTDIVTTMDRAAEEHVVAGLRTARPGDAVLGEEGGRRSAGGPGGLLWVLDPIDGTVNYVYGLPNYAVSLAAEVDGHPLVGVVHNPVTGEVWSAVRGQGATRDGVPLRVGAQTDLGQALVGTGFSYDATVRAHQGRVVAALLPRVRDIRRLGACALDLCHVAEGRLDAYYERGVHRWDASAGALIAAEAGAVVSGLRGQPWSERMTLVAPPALHAPLHDLLVAHDADGVVGTAGT